ncbi:hypothetical protein [Geitlerinema sp. PCC 9228]|jgi:hypothetical protein|uniref:hypothetical protein n=1 Tax=Geitlerinema sp. PCC 9228 TaxID=111611 RepID=UPI0008F994C1|nr:hypothetical protein [Geitlerinema sp. PCC 9228]
MIANKFALWATPIVFAATLLGTARTGWTQNAPTPSQNTTEAEAIAREYIQSLYNFLQREDYEEALSLAREEFSEADHIATAQKSCQLLENGVATVEDLAGGLLSNIVQTMDTEDLQLNQRPLGEYLGISIVLSSVYYCPEHQATVQELFGE